MCFLWPSESISQSILFVKDPINCDLLVFLHHHYWCSLSFQLQFSLTHPWHTHTHFYLFTGNVSYFDYIRLFLPKLLPIENFKHTVYLLLWNTFSLVKKLNPLAGPQGIYNVLPFFHSSTILRLFCFSTIDQCILCPDCIIWCLFIVPSLCLYFPLFPRPPVCILEINWGIMTLGFLI